MKKVLLLLLILVPFSAFARLDLYPGDRDFISKNQACSYNDGFYPSDLQIKGFDNALAVSFVKSQKKLYYVVINTSTTDSDSHFLFSYNCSTKKASLILNNLPFDTLLTKFPDAKNYRIVYIKNKK